MLVPLESQILVNSAHLMEITIEYNRGTASVDSDQTAKYRAENAPYDQGVRLSKIQ